MVTVIMGKLLWHLTFISALSALLAIPFIWAPSIWNYQIQGIGITKYIIVGLATIISLTCLTVQIN